MTPQFADFVDDLKSTHGKNLVSVILYGRAAARGEIRRGVDYNVLIVLRTIGPEDLRRAHACVREWRRLGHPVPVYFTEAEVRDAADVFPIEFQKMQLGRRVLHGRDVLEGLEVSDANFRHQTEYELRSKLIGLRRAYIPASASVEKLSSLMAESLNGLGTLFGAVLVLHGIEVPLASRQIVAKLGDKIGIKGSVFEKILNIRDNNFTRELDEVEANRLFGEFLEEIEKVIDAVDAIG